MEELKADRYRARFVILFDREGYSPEFFKAMWQTHRIACITYHKYPKNDWPAAEFAEIETTLPGGERVSLQLAERGTWIGDKKSGLWVREVRKLTPSGHQVSLISTAYGELALQDAAQLFSRWSQENWLGSSPGNTCPMGWDFLNCLFPPCWGGLSPQAPFHGGNRHGLSGYFVDLGHAM